MKTVNRTKTLVHFSSFFVMPLLFLVMLIIPEDIAGQNSTNGKTVSAPLAPTDPPAPPPPPSRPIHDRSQIRYRIFGADTVYSHSGEMPEFPGGENALEKFKCGNINYPASAKKTGLEGSVIINFNIEKDGSLSDIRVVNGISPSLDTEALRVTRLLPLWQPGKANGKPEKFMSGTSYNFDLISGKLKKKEPADHNRVKVALSTTDDSEVPFVVVEEMPLFPGGDQALLKYIAENTKYPPSAKTNNIQGRVILRFCVTADGDVNRISIMKGVDPMLDSEAIRVVGTLPQFNPGKQSGKAVPVWYMVPITFALDSEMAKGSPSKQDISGYDEVAVFPGGDEALDKFIKSNIKYPKWAKKKKLNGKVNINFCINKNGLVEGVTVYKGIDPELDGEAVRVIRMMPEWKPAKLSGSPVHVWYTIPVAFNKN
jgi:bla regulator protein blaR1